MDKIFSKICCEFLESGFGLGFYLFGSQIETKAKDHFSDIDVLVIVRNKNVETRRILDHLFIKYGYINIIHHPDPYTPRLDRHIPVELLVLPFQSRFLADSKHGIMTGLSAFVCNKYWIVPPSPPLDELVKLPFNNMTPQERATIFLNCEWGPKDVVAKLWPILFKNETIIDVRRLTRFLIMDALWVITGEMCLNLNNCSAILNKKIPKLSHQFDDLINFCRQTTFDSIRNYKYSVDLFELAIELGTFCRSIR